MKASRNSKEGRNTASTNNTAGTSGRNDSGGPGEGESDIKYIMRMYHQELQRERERQPSDNSCLTGRRSVSRNPNNGDSGDNRYVSSLVSFSDMHMSECGRENTNGTRDPRNSLDRILEDRLDMMIREHQTNLRECAKGDASWMDEAGALDRRGIGTSEKSTAAVNQLEAVDQLDSINHLESINLDGSGCFQELVEDGADMEYLNCATYGAEESPQECGPGCDIPTYEHAYTHVYDREESSGKREDEPKQLGQSSSIVHPSIIPDRTIPMNDALSFDGCMGTPSSIFHHMNERNISRWDLSRTDESFLPNDLSQQSLQIHNELVTSQYQREPSAYSHCSNNNVMSAATGWDTYLPEHLAGSDNGTDKRVSVANFHKLVSFMREHSSEGPRDQGAHTQSAAGAGGISRAPQLFQTAEELLGSCDSRAVSLNRLQDNAARTRSEQIQRNCSDASLLKRKLKTYSLEDIRNGKEAMPRVILLPTFKNGTAGSIKESYEQNPQLLKFMQDCNDSVNLIMKYPRSNRNNMSRTLNVPVEMSHAVNAHIGQPITFRDQFDRRQYHPNVRNLHMGPVFERHVFSMLKNKKDLRKSVFKDAAGGRKQRYDPNNGFWISNISKDRLVQPEENDSYITELVYEKNKSFDEEMEAIGNTCPDLPDTVPSVMDHYRNNNFFQFLMNEELYKFNKPEVVTIMRRFDLSHISGYKVVVQTPGITPVHAYELGSSRVDTVSTVGEE